MAQYAIYDHPQLFETSIRSSGECGFAWTKGHGSRPLGNRNILNSSYLDYFKILHLGRPALVLGKFEYISQRCLQCCQAIALLTQQIPDK